MNRDEEYMKFHYEVGCYLVFNLGYSAYEANKIFENMWGVFYNMEHFEVIK